MDLKKLLAKKVVGGILPMDEGKPKLGTKTKAAGILALIAAIASALSNYLG